MGNCVVIHCSKPARGPAAATDFFHEVPGDRFRLTSEAELVVPALANLMRVVFARQVGDVGEV